MKSQLWKVEPMETYSQLNLSHRSGKLLLTYSVYPMRHRARLSFSSCIQDTADINMAAQTQPIFAQPLMIYMQSYCKFPRILQQPKFVFQSSSAGKTESVILPLKSGKYFQSLNLQTEHYSNYLLRIF